MLENIEPLQRPLRLDDLEPSKIRWFIGEIMLNGIHEAEIMEGWANQLLQKRGSRGLPAYVMSISFLKLFLETEKFVSSCRGGKVANMLLLEIADKNENAISTDAYWERIEKCLNKSRPAVAVAKTIISRGPPKLPPRKRSPQRGGVSA